MRALITGITGQDGSYLAELLLNKGYDVYGLVRRSATPSYKNIAGILDGITLLTGDLLDQSSLSLALDRSRPDEVYNLAAMSHVGTSFEQPVACTEYNGLGVLRLLEAIRLSKRDVRFYQASTSEMFGDSYNVPINEACEFHPVSPYGISKLAAHLYVQEYRKSYGLHASCGILFNHESPRRGLDFVTRKITSSTARIKSGLQETLYLGYTGAYRDWGYAPDYVEAMWLMLQCDAPDDYVIATGFSHTVQQFAWEAFEYTGLRYFDHVVEDRTLYRPHDIKTLCGDARKAKEKLNWQPRVHFQELVKLMVNADLELVQGGRLSCVSI